MVRWVRDRDREGRGWPRPGLLGAGRALAWSPRADGAPGVAGVGSCWFVETQLLATLYLDDLGVVDDDLDGTVLETADGFEDASLDLGAARLPDGFAVIGLRGGRKLTQSIRKSLWLHGRSMALVCLCCK